MEPEIILYIGLSLLGTSTMGLLISFFYLKNKKAKLEIILDNEYGKRRII